LQHNIATASHTVTQSRGFTRMFTY